MKIAVPCDADRKPVVSTAIFHDKSGIIKDKVGDRIAFNGSLNETAAGWTRNWESLNVFTSWEDAKRLAREEDNFARIWADRAVHVLTIDVPTAVRDDLFRFLPTDAPPARMKRGPMRRPRAAARAPRGGNRPGTRSPEPSEPLRPPPADLRRLVWGFIRHAPAMPGGGARVGEATCCAVSPHGRIRCAPSSACMGRGRRNC